MTSRPRMEGGASAPSNVLPFPQTKRALWHYSHGMDAAGFLSLLELDRDNKPIPANVRRFDEPDGPGLPEGSAVMLLAVLMLDAMTEKQRERVRRIVRGMAYGPNPSPHALQLHNALSCYALNGRGK